MERPAAAPLPPEVASRLAALGIRIRDARMHRKLRQVDLAERCGLSRSTIEAIERGSAHTAIGAYARVLWVMGLDRELDLVADTALDQEGAALEYKPGERRVRVRKGLNNDF
ncbi:MAG: helix-turn-helix transcriptional regulator [Pseudomonadota bacterium]